MPDFVKILITVSAAIAVGTSMLVSTAFSVVGGAGTIEWGDDITMLLGFVLLVLIVIAEELRTQNHNTHGTE